jgi:4-amino-4-deoxy-L-arabinose transferase-like glycosyltransferase
LRGWRDGGSQGIGELMRNRLVDLLLVIALIAGSVGLGVFVVSSPDVGLTILVGLVPVFFCVWILLREPTDLRFVLRLFLIALVLRWMVAFLIYSKGLQHFFGGDAETFDIVGNAISQAWQGQGSMTTPYMQSYVGNSRSGWGMFYYVAAVYYTIGQNQLAIQLLNCALGAAACIAVYKIAMLVYPQPRVARIAAVMIALSPSMILWSSQVLKDAPIVLSLCLCSLYTLRLREKFKLRSLILLLASLFCLYALRHYAAYIMFVAICGSLLLTARRFTPLRILQGSVLAIVLGMAMAYFGAADVPKESFDLKKIQASRVWSAKEANSGYGGDVDISDPKAAIEFLPVGLMYVLFAPFPWMMTNLRQLITLPELLVWWALVPMLIKGYWFAMRHRLKESFAICVFTIGLTLCYALYQSNVGTAYRHRAQLYIFFIIFISVGLELRRDARQRQRASIAPAHAGFAPLATATAKTR